MYSFGVDPARKINNSSEYIYIYIYVKNKVYHSYIIVSCLPKFPFITNLDEKCLITKKLRATEVAEIIINYFLGDRLAVFERSQSYIYTIHIIN